MDKIFAKAFETKSNSKKASAEEDEKLKTTKAEKKSEGRNKAIKKPNKPNKPKATASKVELSARRKTDDGYTIYKEDELNLGIGGDTGECPFDCKCCY